jgi:DNA-directed RNA polymerase specialized sigma24 family protein
MTTPEPLDSNSSNHSVTEWIDCLKGGDPKASNQLWQRYFERLIRLASRKIATLPRRVVDEDDIVNSVFFELLSGIEKQRFPDLHDRQDLWQILIMLTERQAIGVRRQQLADKRGGKILVGESALDHSNTSQLDGIQQVPGDHLTPEFAALCAEALAMRLTSLQHDPTLVEIARDKLSGFTNEEIAQRLDTSLRSVERNLSRIRQIWKHDPS